MWKYFFTRGQLKKIKKWKKAKSASRKRIYWVGLGSGVFWKKYILRGCKSWLLN